MAREPHLMLFIGRCRFAPRFGTLSAQRSDRVREGRYDLVLHIERFVKWWAIDAHRFQ